MMTDWSVREITVTFREMRSGLQLLQLALISYHDRFVRLLYTQLYMYRYMSPRYFGKQHWRRRYQSWWYTHLSLKKEQ